MIFTSKLFSVKDYNRIQLQNGENEYSKNVMTLLSTHDVVAKEGGGGRLFDLYHRN